MKKKTTRGAGRDRNESARLKVMGALQTGTFESREAAMRAALSWGWAAHCKGEKLGALAVLIDGPEPSVKTTLGRVHYWKSVARQAGANAIHALDVALEKPRADDELILLDPERDSSVVVSLAELKGAANAR